MRIETMSCFSVMLLVLIPGSSIHHLFNYGKKERKIERKGGRKERKGEGGGETERERGREKY